MNEKFLKKCIKIARKHSMNYEGGPFGAVVVKDGKIIGRGWNKVIAKNDPTAHAEITAIRTACRKLNTYDLTGCDIYSSTEPCPMCLAAIYWARLNALYYGNNREDAAKIGFDDAFIYEEFNKSELERKLKIQGGVMARDVDELFEEWEQLEGKVVY